MRGRQIPAAHHRRRHRIGRAQRDAARTGRLAGVEADAHCGKPVGTHQRPGAARRAGIAERREIKLRIGRAVPARQPDETARLIEAHRQRAFLRQHVLQTRQRLAPPRAQHLIEAGLRRAEQMIAAKMIHQVPAHMRRVMDHVDAHIAQMRGRADPRQHHQLRRVDRAAAENDLPGAGDMRPALLHIFDPGRAAPLHHDARRHRARLDPQVLQAARAPQIRLRGRGAPPPGGRDLVGTRAFKRGAVIVGVGGDARLLGCLDVGARQRVHRAVHIRHRQRPVAAAMRAGAARPFLQPAKDGRDIVPAPARRGRGPLGVVIRVPAHPDHRVDRGRSAQNLAARPVDGAPVQLRLGLGRVFPVEPCVVEYLAIAQRDINPRVPPAAARLQQQHRFSGARQPGGQRGPGRSRADDDMVIMLHRDQDLSRPKSAASTIISVVTRTMIVEIAAMVGSI